MTLWLIIAALVAAGLFGWLCYRKGRKDAHAASLAASAELLAETQVKQGQREANHVKRVEKIVRGDQSVDDIIRELSAYPPENTATHAALKKAR